jgi:hypothetical protein
MNDAAAINKTGAINKAGGSTKYSKKKYSGLKTWLLFTPP